MNLRLYRDAWRQLVDLLRSPNAHSDALHSGRVMVSKWNCNTCISISLETLEDPMSTNEVSNFLGWSCSSAQTGGQSLKSRLLERAIA